MTHFFNAGDSYPTMTGYVTTSTVVNDLARRVVAPGPRECRSYPAEFEIRSVAGSPSKIELRGYASVFDRGYDMFDMYGPYTEIARSGMFTKTLNESPDVAYLANHEGLTMARTNSGSLTLTQDSTGLLTSAMVNTQRQDARDLVTAIEDGDVDQMSFAFRVRRQEWSPDYTQRDLLEVDINRGDVSAVNFGASPSTNVGVARAFRTQRSAELHRLGVEIRSGAVLSARSAAQLADLVEVFAVSAERDERKGAVIVDGDPLAALDFLKRQLERETR